MRPVTLLLLCCLLLALLGCQRERPDDPTAEPTATPRPDIVRVTGATAMEPLLRELARAYMQEQPGVIVGVAGGGSRWGVEAVQGGEAEIGMVSRPLSEAEQGSLRVIPLARDGLAFIVHPDNPINRLDREQLAAIYRGEIFLWDDLGWLAGITEMASREAGSGDRAVVLDFLGLPEADLSPNTLLMPDAPATVTWVANTPTALGYVSLAQLSGSVKALRLGEAAPTREALAEGRYPLARDLLLVTGGEPEGPTRQFLDWLRTPAARAIVERRYLPLDQ